MRRSRVRGALVPLLVGAARRVLPRHPGLSRPREAFGLSTPSGLPIVVSIICTTFAIGALGMLGLSLTRPGGEQVQVVRFWRRASS